MKIKAYAKINLRLKVLGTTTNSYHLLQMVNSKVGLYDEVIIKKIRQKTIDIDMPYVSKEDNLVYKVALKMFNLFNLPGGIYIKIKKNIPIGAGLAGGSSDAATVINAINKMYKLNLNIDELRSIALEFGTDIVYCLENKLALVEGIGEKITILKRKIKSNVLIINPNFSVLTKEIFTLFDENKIYSDKLTIDKIESLSIEELLENDLEKTTFRLYPDVEKLKESLKNNGFKNVLMTGTGATLFVLGNKKELKGLYKKYQKEYKDYNIYLTKIINK
jgi:4-diphosphocytidyl-2-C-methyl-D-erythritol kinase